ncbi:MAG: TIGR04222 domain-containing membrane protein [Armatimonadetes bacterium]|nr:TIGR04222 domain-containing membrane protein [Armatimonadota bacterium]
MDWLLHGPIGGMSGPDFLLLYAVVIVTAAMLALLARPMLDPTRDAAPPRIPESPDAFALAYLRGGAGEVAQLALFTLIERGYLWHDAMAHTVAPAPNPPESEPPARVLQRSLAALGDQPRRVHEALAVVNAACAPACGSFESALREERLLTSQQTLRCQFGLLAVTLVLVEGLGLFKLAAALAKGRTNVGFLLLMMVAAALVLGFCLQPRRLSARGQAYLDRARQRFRRLRDRLGREPGHGLNAAQVVLAVFGLSSLAGTAWAWTVTEFRPPQTSSNGCSGSTGCSGSSGCSGGSSGCGGGGGCGGCSGD